ncbi:type II toxin-antitoxin system PemK/MazF family toxin [Plantactinospora sp. S1510]|uniref:Type II toxin-antitoxin system PemK/MazF family toxin n=1 Tax=Plantactinospora alkalitolerans TaxID=2789879 RepID=A0ABS0GRW9_9ACTN|nr:type II toxin-antitoxin system PemK/MazF family toxin [Plantactinospora alkalitolerans]MBF9128925.1 type II toxin-antitoxin system PemK/MazF family toxin [Plantactinospora alkalitolerans]
MGDRVRRGSILQYVVGSHRLRVVVVTADRYNPRHGLVAPLRERAAPDLVPAFLVPLSRQDWPTAAVIDLSRARSLDPESVAGTAGQLTPTTLNTLTTAIRTYLGAVD